MPLKNFVRCKGKLYRSMACGAALWLRGDGATAKVVLIQDARHIQVKCLVVGDEGGERTQHLHRAAGVIFQGQTQ